MTTLIIKQLRVQQDINYWNALLAAEYSARSIVSIKRDWEHFCDFGFQAGINVLPATTDTLIRFIDRMARERKYATLRRYVISINRVHQLCSLPQPGNSSQVDLVMAKFRIDKKDDHIQADAFRRHHLDKLQLQLGQSERLKDIRDLAIWTLMFECMIKRGELLALDVQDFDYDAKLLTFDDEQFQLSDDCNERLQTWISAGALVSGPLFRAIDRHGNVSEPPIDPSGIYRVFRRANEELGLPKHVKFSGQSPRVGAAKDLSEEGSSINEIQHAGRWRSAAMPAQYLGKKESSEQEKAKYRKKKQW
uniref:tyrosine-type recombinase/integrase n=1 Tax=Thaumasiovibrio occultus TaxID=1891184 RepID=UPI000B353F4E|nr:tyrosine-type recombinase/integrase [Thaumasiovibrio occultus]